MILSSVHSAADLVCEHAPERGTNCTPTFHFSCPPPPPPPRFVILLVDDNDPRHVSVQHCAHVKNKKAEGAKYERALLWGVPVVTAGWLLCCAQHGYAPGTEDLYHPARVSAAGATVKDAPAVEAAPARTSSADPSPNAITPSIDSGRPGQSNSAFEPPPPVEGARLSRVGDKPSPTEGKDKETAESGGRGYGVVGSGQARGSTASAESTSSVADPVNEDKVGPGASGLELQLRSMLSAGAGGGSSGLSSSGGGGREAPPHATRRRLHLSAWGARSTIRSSSPGLSVSAREAKPREASTPAGTARGVPGVSSPPTPKLGGSVSASLSSPPPLCSSPSSGVTPADGDAVGLDDLSDCAIAAASSPFSRSLSTPPRDRGCGKEEEEGENDEDVFRRGSVLASTSPTPPPSPQAHSAFSGHSALSSSAEVGGGKWDAAALAEGDLECQEVLSSPTAPTAPACREESRGGRAALFGLGNGLHDRSVNVSSRWCDGKTSGEGRVRSAATRDDVLLEGQENEPYRRRRKLVSLVVPFLFCALRAVVGGLCVARAYDTDACREREEKRKKKHARARARQPLDDANETAL